jgi:hypothetical protein
MTGISVFQAQVMLLIYHAADFAQIFYIGYLDYLITG